MGESSKQVSEILLAGGTDFGEWSIAGLLWCVAGRAVLGQSHYYTFWQRDFFGEATSRAPQQDNFRISNFKERACHENE
jgi:hypothetical protein